MNDTNSGRVVNWLRSIAGWVAVVTSTLLAGVWAFWGIIENFHEGWWGPSLADKLVMLVMYLLPMTAFVTITLISIRWPRIGGGLHFAAALFALWFFGGDAARHLIAFPFALLGLVYWIGRPEPRKWAYAAITIVPHIAIAQDFRIPAGARYPLEVRRMSQLKSEVPRKRRRFTEEFKQDAVRLVVSEGYTFAAAAKAVGVGEQSLRKWHARLAPPPVPCGEGASLEELREEN